MNKVKHAESYYTKVPFHADTRYSFSVSKKVITWRKLIFIDFDHVTYFDAENELQASVWKRHLKCLYKYNAKIIINKKVSRWRKG